jgi:hypothetical protein
VETAVAGADIDDGVGEHRSRTVLVVVEDQRIRRNARHASIAEVVAPQLLAVGTLELVHKAVVAGEEDSVLGDERAAINRPTGRERPQ